jgi:hypothetical protein
LPSAACGEDAAPEDGSPPAPACEAEETCAGTECAGEDERDAKVTACTPSGPAPGGEAAFDCSGQEGERPCMPSGGEPPDGAPAASACEPVLAVEEVEV